jgi:hypothetical protein
MTKTAFLLSLIFAISASAVAQTTNYDLPQNWMCHPILKSTDIARQQSLTLTVKLPNLSADTVIAYTSPTTDTGVDIFYVYPTISMNPTSRNIDIPQIDTITAKFVYREQVGIYAQLGRVFVPYYKQATIGVFTYSPKTDAELLQQENYLEVAYKDVEAAFDHYLEHYNKGNKIILMGHSQGSDLMMFLLRNRFDNNPVLTSQLVVAISGGEPYYSAKDSRTGGILEHIKTLGSELESGCIISWRAWRSGTQGGALDSSSFFYNHYFAEKGLIYQTYDKNKPGIHQESNYDFGYSTNKPITRYITLSPDSTEFWGFDGMFNARFFTDNTKQGCSYLMIETNAVPNDQRAIPNPKLSPLLPEIPIPDLSHFSHTPNNNYHCWDMQFVQGDLLNLIPELIKVTQPISSVPEVSDFENTILIYPNPTSGIVHVNNSSKKIKSIKLYNLQGEFIEEFFTNDFSVSTLPAGIYFINVQTDQSTFVNKLIKQ